MYYNIILLQLNNGVEKSLEVLISHAGSTDGDTTVVAVSHLTTLYHVHCTQNRICDVVENLHSALVSDACEVGTPPIVVLHSRLTQLLKDRSDV